MDDNNTVIQADSTDIRNDETKENKKNKRLRTGSAFLLGTTVLLAIILVLGAAGAWWYYNNFFTKTTARVDELNAYYEQEYNALLDKYNGLVSDYDAKAAELEQLKADNEVTLKNLENLEATLDEYNKKIEENNKAEEEFATSLSDEDLSLQRSLMVYNADLWELRKSNPEFNALYLDVCKSILKGRMLNESEVKDFLDKYTKLDTMIKEYRAGLTGSDGDDGE